MSVIRLRVRTPLFRDTGGATHIALPRGHSLRFGRGLAPLLDELRGGIPVQEWLHRMKTNPIVAQVDFALGEHHLVEHVDSAQAMPLIRAIPPTETNTVIWWLHVIALLATAMTCIIFHIQIANAIATPLPWQAWPIVPAALATTLLFHEVGHYAIARLCGQHAIIRPWQARCVITPVNVPFSSTQKLLVLAAGPWSDCLLLFAATMYLSFSGENSFIRLTAVCALSGLIFNLYPRPPSDFYKILSLAPDQTSRRWARCIYWVLLPLMIISDFIAMVALLGFSPIILS